MTIYQHISEVFPAASMKPTVAAKVTAGEGRVEQRCGGGARTRREQPSVARRLPDPPRCVQAINPRVFAGDGLNSPH